MKAIKRDLYGNPIKPRPKCANCGKEDWHHRAKTHECPKGRKHRVMGYMEYGPEVFADIPRKNK